jgi:8-oxo-dGTP diphosphatase
MNLSFVKSNIGCNVLVFNKKNQLLLGMRKNCKEAGSFGLPGGHVHNNESLINAARREIKEECGIISKNLKFLSILDDELKSEKYMQINFVLYNYAGKIKLCEPNICKEWKWFSLNKIPKNLFSQHRSIIKMFLNKQLYYY